MNDSTGKPRGEALLDAIAHFQPPWVQDAHVWREKLAQLLQFDTAVLGVFNPDHPSVETFLLADNVDANKLSDWCARSTDQDPLLAASLKQGVCVMQTDESLLEGHCVSASAPACPQHGTIWWFALSRKSKAFDETEQATVAVLLRTFAAKFDFPAEQDLGRLLLNSELELIHADPVSCLRMMQHPSLLPQLGSNLKVVADQRWNKLEKHHTHSVFLEVDGRPVWIRFRCGSADSQASTHWYLEVRPLEVDDPPPVDVVEDQRVGEAMGFLSDHFKQAPVLGDVAAHVNTSPFHFHRLFTKQAGISPKHFLLRTQLLHAKHMLRATRMPIGDIARESGFASHGHFTATFNRIVGQSPSDYRENA